MTNVYLGIGSNFDQRKNISACLDGLKAVFDQLVLSPIYESEAVGLDSPNFYNLVVGVITDLPLVKLAQIFRHLEKDFGRELGGNRYKKVTIDIDILLYGDRNGVFDTIQLPRPEILTNAFVLLPLSEIAADVIHPVTGKTYFSHWEAYDKASQKLWPVCIGD